MNRKQQLSQLTSTEQWDVVIVGGGASGLGIAVDAAQRGYKTLLVEKYDFAKGTSSRSTKLVHGGVRYLQNGDVSLVIEALKERGLMKLNAPHLVQDMSFIIPTYHWWAGLYYGLGLKIYDMMAGKLGLKASSWISKEETLDLLDNLNEEELHGGVIYHDGQFDDARMAVTLAQTAIDLGGCLLNYMELVEISKTKGKISGATIRDNESGEVHQVKTKVLINATGVFADGILQLDEPNKPKMLTASQGVHLVLDSSFLEGEHAFMIPNTTDGRVLFAVPWHDHVVVGTTDTPLDDIAVEPQALEEEIDFILNNAALYMKNKPTRADVKSIFAGLRPLVSVNDPNVKSKEISRHHKVNVSESGLVSILGGKWTTYRKMAEDTLDTATLVGDLEMVPCNTEKLKLHGYMQMDSFNDPLHFYGSDKDKVENTGPEEDNQSLSEYFHLSKNQIIWSVRYEMALHVEDIVARRNRCLFLNAKETLSLVPIIAKIMAVELGRDEDWVKEEIKQAEQLINQYIL